MRSTGATVAFHMAHQLIDTQSAASEQTLFAQALNSVIDGFVPASVYVCLASRREPAWRTQRSERQLEERAKLLLDHSLNPVALAGKSLRDLHALKQVSDLFHRNDALAVKTKMNIVGAGVQIIRETSSAAPCEAALPQRSRGNRADAFHASEDQPSPLAWEHLSVCQDAVACLIDVTRQQIGRPLGAQAPSSSPGSTALLSLGRRLHQQDSATFALLQALEEHPALTLNQAAKALGCSRHTLQRHLQPMAVSLPRLRLAGGLLRAIRMLSQGGDLSQTATDAGFFDYPHFARTFKRSSGFLPTTYQRVLKSLDLARLHSLV